MEKTSQTAVWITDESVVDILFPEKQQNCPKLCDRYDPDWIPNHNLGYDKCDSFEKLQADLEAAARWKRVVAENYKRLREEIEAKRQTKMVIQEKRS